MRRGVAVVAFGAVCVVQWSCFRGTLPPRQFYRLAPVDSVASASRPAGAPPLTGGIAIHAYDTPGIYGSGSLVYRVGASAYATYPSREWAIPLGEMIAALTETIARPRALTSGRVAFDSPSARREQYEWRGTVNEFDEVDAVNSVSASVGLSAQLVRVVDDSVVWSGTAREVEPVRESQNIDSVVASLSIAATRAVTRLADAAASALRRLAAAGAPDR